MHDFSGKFAHEDFFRQTHSPLCLHRKHWLSGSNLSRLSAEELTENEELENERMESLDFASKSGFREYPQLLMNGVPIERENLGSR